MSDFDELYITWYARVKKFAATYVKSEDDAEDIVQDVFMRLYERNNADGKNMVGYLFTAVKHACINCLRDRLAQNSKTSEMQNVYRMEMQLGYEALEQTETDFQSEEEISQMLNEAISKLPEKCRQIFVMSRLQGIKHAEIARQLDISTNTIESQIGIAYRKLRKELKNYIPLLLFLFISYR